MVKYISESKARVLFGKQKVYESKPGILRYIGSDKLAFKIRKSKVK